MPPEFTIIQKCVDFEIQIAPKISKQLELTRKVYYNNYIQEEFDPTNLIKKKYFMKEIQAFKIEAINMQCDDFKLKLVNFK